MSEEDEIDMQRLRIENMRKENERILSNKLALEWFPVLDKQIGCYDYRVATSEISRAFDVFRKRLLDPCYEENERLKARIIELESRANQS